MVKRPFLIGIAGGTCCGKSEVCKKIFEYFEQNGGASENGKQRIILLKQDSFYRELSSIEAEAAFSGKFNFDHPEAFDEEYTLDVIKKLKSGERVRIPQYNMKTHSREGDPPLPQMNRCAGDSSAQWVTPSDVILFEGILVLYNKEIRSLMDMKIFVDTDSDTRLARRVLRDTLEHGRDIDTVLNAYTMYVKPAFEDFSLPTKKYADVIIPRGASNTVALQLIIQHIADILKGDGSKPRRSRTKSESSAASGSRPH